MASYDYRCRVCDTAFEIRRSVTDPPGDVRCPQGHGDSVRVWSAIAVMGSAVTARGPATASADRAGGGCCGGGCCG